MSIKAKLKENGKSLRGWAIARGYSPSTAQTVMRRWGQRDDTPHGGISRQIMASLRREFQG